MSYRNSFGAARPAAQDRSFSDLFEYVGPGDVGPRGYNDSSSAVPFEDEDAPDILNIKHMGDSFRLRFPPYSISESGVTVQEVRRRVAEGLRQDPRKIRLQYKDRELRFDPYPIKKYGCKQNSEIHVIVTESLNDYGGGDNNQSSSEDSSSGSSLKPPAERRPRGLSTVRYRVEEVQKPVNTTGFLHPNGATFQEGNGERKRSRSPGHRRDRRETYASTDKPPPSPRPSATPALRTPAADPNTPLGKVQTLYTVYSDKWLPECQQFLRSPPSDKTQREKEYRRLSESVMMHVIEAADAIDLQGDQNAKTERRKMLGEAQELLRKLDAIKKLDAVRGA